MVDKEMAATSAAIEDAVRRIEVRTPQALWEPRGLEAASEQGQIVYSWNLLAHSLSLGIGHDEPGPPRELRSETGGEREVSATSVPEAPAYSSFPASMRSDLPDCSAVHVSCPGVAEPCMMSYYRAVFSLLCFSTGSSTPART